MHRCRETSRQPEAVSAERHVFKPPKTALEQSVQQLGGTSSTRSKRFGAAATAPVWNEAIRQHASTQLDLVASDRFTITGSRAAPDNRNHARSSAAVRTVGTGTRSRRTSARLRTSIVCHCCFSCLFEFRSASDQHKIRFLTQQFSTNPFKDQSNASRSAWLQLLKTNGSRREENKKHQFLLDQLTSVQTEMPNIAAKNVKVPINKDSQAMLVSSLGSRS